MNIMWKGVLYRSLLTVFCLALCACTGSGSGSGSGSSDNTTSPPNACKIADYQGLFLATLERPDKTVTGVPIYFDIDSLGHILSLGGSTSPIEQSLTVLKIIAATFTNISGQIQNPTTIVVTDTRETLNITYVGYVDLANEGTFDISYSYTGSTTSGSFRIYGTRPNVVASINPPTTTIGLNLPVTLNNSSLDPFLKFPLGNQITLNTQNLVFNWTIISAPTGSLAPIINSSSSFDLSKVFVADKTGTYVITLTARNGAGTLSSTDITINAI